MAKDLAVAEDGYEAVVVQDGWEDDMGAHYWLGRLAERRKEWPAAIDHFDVVLRQFPDHYPTLVARADASYYAGRKTECAAYLLRAYKVPGNRTTTGVKLVKLLRRLDRADEAATLMAADPKLARHPKLQQ
jgi:lipopolysaccharide biosynthesis regulator YciM